MRFKASNGDERLFPSGCAGRPALHRAGLYIAHNYTYTGMERTTIAIPPKTRDRLRRYGTKGMSYGQILDRMMDELERERFVAEMRRLADEGEFLPLEKA